MAIDLGMVTREELDNPGNVCMEGYDIRQVASETIASKLKLAARCPPDIKMKVVQDL